MAYAAFFLFACLHIKTDAKDNILRQLKSKFLFISILRFAGFCKMYTENFAERSLIFSVKWKENEREAG